jgi:hypothetical protein
MPKHYGRKLEDQIIAHLKEIEKMGEALYAGDHGADFDSAANIAFALHVSQPVIVKYLLILQLAGKVVPHEIDTRMIQAKTTVWGLSPEAEKESENASETEKEKE